MPRLLFRFAFIAFATCFVSIIVLADRGQAGQLWTFAGQVPCGDKLGHLALAGTFSVLLNVLLERRPAPGAFAPLMLGSLLLLVGMTLEECSQMFFPSRSFDGFDGLANVIGVICGEGLVRMLPENRVQAG